MIGLSGCINLDNSQRLEAAFDLYDLEGSSLLPIVSILQIFQVNRDSKLITKFICV